MNQRLKVLFVCSHNSARSQMAAALLNHLHGDDFEAASGGLEPGTLNPLAIEAMRLVGVDISHAKTQSVFDVYTSGELFAYVISMCDQESAEKCPLFPGAALRLHWSFPDPSLFEGSWEGKLARTVEIRDKIAETIEEWCQSVR